MLCTAGFACEFFSHDDLMYRNAKRIPPLPPSRCQRRHRPAPPPAAPPANGRPDRLHVKRLLNPPFVEQRVGILRASSLRERAYAVLTESGLWQQGGLPTQTLQRARQLLSASDSTMG